MGLTILALLWLPMTPYAQSVSMPKRPLVEIRTSAGNMIVALYNETPVHRDQFLELVQTGAFDSLLFHRVVPGFAIEGGDLSSKHARAGVALGLDTDTIGLPEEIVPGRIHSYGTLAAAAAGDLPELDGRTHRTRFFIVLGNTYAEAELNAVAERNAEAGRRFEYSPEDRQKYATAGGQPRLDGAYTVFGEVVHGLEVLDSLQDVPCNEWDRPMTDIRMFMRVLK